MNITFSPMRREGRYTLVRTGDTLTIDGEAFDFSTVPNGATLPGEAVNSDWIAGPVARDANGVLTVPLILPHGPGAPDETRFPAPLSLTADGPVHLPPHDTRKEGAA